MKRAGGHGLEASAVIAVATARATARAMAVARALVIAMGLAFVLGGGGCNSRPTCQNGWVYFDQVGSCVPPCEQSYGYEQCYGRDGGLQRSDAAAEAGDAGDAASEGGGDGGAGDGDGSACGRADDAAAVPSAPQPIAPQSGSYVHAERPLFRWLLPPASDGVAFRLCRDREMSVGCGDGVAPGTSTARISLTTGVWFWQLRAVRAGEPTGCYGPIWSFTVEHTSAASVSSSGSALDFNGDGLTDFVVRGSPGHPRDAVLLPFVGSPRGPERSTASPPLPAEPDATEIASVLLNAGDLDGDGFGDVVFSVHTQRDAILFAYFGSRSGLHAPATELGRYPLFTRQLVRVAALGDVDADGFSDLAVRTVIGPPIVKTPAQRRFLTEVLYGTPRTRPVRVQVLHDDPVPISPDAALLVSADDIDGDGYRDVLIGTQLAMPTRNRIILYYGGPAGAMSSRSTVVDSPSTGVDAFAADATAQDVTGDGFPELLVTQRSLADGHQQVATFLGGPGGVTAMPFGMPLSQAASDYARVLGIHDFDGDGVGDAAFLTLSLGRRLSAYFGSSAGLAPSASRSIDPISPGISVVHFLGDTNGDGRVEIGIVNSDGTSPTLLVLAPGATREVVVQTSIPAPSGTREFGYFVASSR